MGIRRAGASIAPALLSSAHEDVPSFPPFLCLGTLITVWLCRALDWMILVACFKGFPQQRCCKPWNGVVSGCSTPGTTELRSMTLRVGIHSQKSRSKEAPWLLW